MKKISILVASILVFGSFGTRAFASEVNTQTTQTTEATVSFKEDAGITPDSLLYTIDKAVDNLRILIATSDEKEAEVIADVAQERLGESEAMAEEGETELAEKALEEYNDKITEAVDKLQSVVNNTEATSEDKVDEKLEQSIADLEKAIQEVQEKSLVVLSGLQKVIAKEAADTVEKIIEEQTAHKEAVSAFVKERHEFNVVKKDLNMAKVSLKKLEKSEDADAKSKAKAELTLKQEAYMTAKADLQAAFKIKQAAEKDGAKVVEGKEKVKSDSAEATTVVEQNSAAIEETKTAEYTKTNNGNGNGNIEKSTKIEDKKDKEQSAPGKSNEENGKSGQSNNNKKISTTR
jgi:hypothetical protein